MNHLKLYWKCLKYMQFYFQGSLKFWHQNNQILCTMKCSCDISKLRNFAQTHFESKTFKVIPWRALQWYTANINRKFFGECIDQKPRQRCYSVNYIKYLDELIFSTLYLVLSWCWHNLETIFVQKSGAHSWQKHFQAPE